MKILHSIPCYAHGLDRLWGVSNSAMDFASMQAMAGHDVNFLSPLATMGESYDKPKETQWCDGQLNGFYVPQAKHTRFGTSKDGLSEHRELFASADIVHVHGFFSPWADKSISLARSTKKPYVIQPHGKFGPGMLSNRQLPKKIHLFFRGLKQIKQSQGVVTLAQAMADSVKQICPSANTFVIPNGLDIKQYSVPQPPPPLPKPYLLFLGMLDPRKRIDLLIRSFSKAKTQHPELQLALVGGDNYGLKPQLLELTQSEGLFDSVHFVGHVSGDTKLAYLQHAELFVLPSAGEGLSLAMLEALACGVPCLLSKGCNAPEIDEYSAGQTVGDDEWGTVLANWVSDQQQLSTARNNAKKLFDEKFDLRSVSKQMLELYEKIHVQNKDANLANASP